MDSTDQDYAYLSMVGGSHVDETLFGTKKAKRGTRATEELFITGRDTVMCRKKGGSRANKASAATYLTASELNKIKESCTIRTAADELNDRKRAEEERQERMQASVARKKKMMKLEEDRKRLVLMSDTEQKIQAQKNGVLANAQKKLDEQNDDVKKMNQMVLYSKCVTIRDAQLQEKRYIQQNREEEEQQLDMMMEIERLKALKMEEVRNKQRLDDQRKGASVIVEQIKERQAARRSNEEHRDQERMFILKQIEALKQEEIEQAKNKQVAANRLMEEVNLANSAAMRIKEERMLQEKLEDEQIAEYQRQKAAREEAIEQEKAAAEKAKSEAQKKMLDQQERSQGKADEMDALRAKRAAEAAERAARQKEQDEAKRMMTIAREMAEARMAQQREKEQRLATQAQFEKDEFLHLAAVSAQQAEAEAKRAGEQRMANLRHVEQLRAQITAVEERNMQERHAILEEGNKVRNQQVAQRKKLEAIKEKKIAELQKSGVPEKYWSELARKKISV